MRERDISKVFENIDNMTKSISGKLDDLGKSDMFKDLGDKLDGLGGQIADIGSKVEDVSKEISSKLENINSEE